MAGAAQRCLDGHDRARVARDVAVVLAGGLGSYPAFFLALAGISMISGVLMIGTGTGAKPEDDAGGQTGGRTQLASACLSSPQLAWACVVPPQSRCGDYSSLLVIHGKEKVYGSIP